MKPPVSRLRKNLAWAAALVALLVVSTALEVWLQGAAGVPLATNILIFALVNLNILLLMAFALLLFRNLAKLFLERRRKVIGARLRTRLVVAFVGLASLPALLLFLVSWKLITSSIQGWFDARVEASLRLASDLATDAERGTERTALGQAERLAEEIARLDLAGAGRREQLARHLRSRVREFGLSAVSWYDAPGGRPVLLAVEPDHPAPAPAPLPPERLRDAWAGRSGLVTAGAAGGGKIVQGFWPVRDSETRPVRGVVAAALHIPAGLRDRLTAASTAYESYRQLRLFRTPIRLSYTLTLATIALLITFSATWFAFYLSRVITTPIQRLAEGTRRIAGGDLDFEIAADAQDEIGLLVASFNRMTRDLRSNKSELDSAYRTLQRSSLELERRTEMIETILETVATGVISLDPAGTVTTCNRSAGLMLGIGPAEAVGHPAAEVLRDSALGALREAVAAPAGTSWDGRVTLAGEGQARTLVVNVVGLRDRRGADLGRLVVLEDLTQLVKAQRAAAWREAARRIAHEIKNPLTPIQLSVQRARKKILERAPDREAVFLEAAATVTTQVDAMKRLVDEFSRFARLPSHRPEPVDIREVIAAALGLYEPSRPGVSFRTDLHPGPLVVDADREQLRRVFINLFENALDALDGPGTVTVATEPVAGAEAVRVRVADTGRGIPAEHRDRLFLPDVTTKKEGGGLGLAIVSDIVTEHGGTVRVEDNSPRGTAFIIELPLRRGGQPPGATEVPHAG